MDPFSLLASSPETTKLLIDLLVVFAAAKILAEVAEQLGQPGIVGEILAGILIGPAVFGWIQPTEFLSALSELGVMFLLFRVGLEVKASELAKVGGPAMIVAFAGVAVPMGMGYSIARAFDQSVISSLFIGCAMVATSVGITAQVLSAKGVLHHRASKMILAAAVVDDVLGLIALAVVGSVARNEIRVADIVTTAFMAIGFTLIVARFGTPAMARLIPKADNFKAGESQFNVALILLFGLSVVAIYAGVAAIIGAFLAGMALAESVDQRVHHLAHGVSELLVPFFLAGIGFSLDLKPFADPRILGFAVVILVAAVASKLIGCGFGAWKFGRKDMFRVGAGMVPRGEVGMVVAQLGLASGAITGASYGVVVFMAVLTTMAAPPLLTMAFRGAEDEK